MIKSFWKRADFLSPRDLLQRAGVIIFAFLLAHLCGLREFTSVLNGTVGSVAVGWRLSMFFGLIYLVLYMAVVVLVPIMILAAIILTAIDRLVKRVRNQPS